MHLPIAMRRNSRGSMMFLAPVGALIIILLGAISFDVFSIREQYNELKAATDAAALAAATHMSDPANTNADVTKQVGLTYFQMNQLMSGSLASATLSPSAMTDNPQPGQSTLTILLNPAEKKATAQASFGFRPSLLKFLGTYAIHATSTAGPAKSIIGDVCIVLDLSCSMHQATNNKNTVQTSREFHKKSDFLTYRLKGPPGGKFPNLSSDPNGAASKAIPDPKLVLYSPPGGSPIVVPAGVGSAPFLVINERTPLMKSALDQFAGDVANPPSGFTVPTNPFSSPPNQPVTVDDIKQALLIEAKRGNLENPAVFASSHANASVLKFVRNFQPQVGFQKEGQLIALTLVQSRASCVQAIHFFIDHEVENKADIHWSLVGFGQSAAKPNTNPARVTLDPTKVSKFTFPLVPLDKVKDNAKEVEDAIDMATLSCGTNIPAGLKAGIAQLTGPGHRPGLPRTIILLTDGMPTVSGSSAMAQLAGSKGIRLITIGFFLANYAIPGGPKFCKKIAVKAGNGSQSFLVGDGKAPLPTPDEVNLEAQNAVEKILVTATESGPICLQ